MGGIDDAIVERLPREQRRVFDGLFGMCDNQGRQHFRHRHAAPNATDPVHQIMQHLSAPPKSSSFHASSIGPPPPSLPPSAISSPRLSPFPRFYNRLTRSTSPPPKTSSSHPSHSSSCTSSHTSRNHTTIPSFSPLSLPPAGRPVHSPVSYRVRSFGRPRCSLR